LHAWVESAEISGFDFRKVANLISPDMDLLDHLIANFDRHKKNSMWTIAQYFFGIDHGRIGASRAKPLNPKVIPSARVLKSLWQFLESGKLASFCNELSELRMERMLGRVQVLKSWWKNRPTPSFHRPLDRRLRLSEPRNFASLSADSLASLKSFSSEILKKSKKGLDPDLSDYVRVNAETLPLMASARNEIIFSVENEDMSSIRRYYQMAAQDADLKVEFMLGLAGRVGNDGQPEGLETYLRSPQFQKEFRSFLKENSIQIQMQEWRPQSYSSDTSSRRYSDRFSDRESSSRSSSWDSRPEVRICISAHAQ